MYKTVKNVLSHVSDLYTSLHLTGFINDYHISFFYFLLQLKISHQT